MNYKEKFIALLRSQELSKEQKEKLENIFPELKDWDLFQIPEKEIADEWDGHTPQDATERLHKYLLEKQGEHKPILDFKASDWYVSKVDGKIHNMYYSANKVEPKFHEGEWIKHQGTENIYQVIARIDNQYQLKYGDNYTIQKCADVDRCARLWTIADAKNGDVLYSLDSKQPFIYKERPQFSQARGHCCINKFGEFAIWNTSKCVICTDKYIPATKEQRYLLFQKMKEAGYEWDAEKKELKKIEPKALDPDKVIEWLDRRWPYKRECGSRSSQVAEAIKRFKKDFGLC